MNGTYDVTIIGNVTRDPKLKETPKKGTPVANFGVAVNREGQETVYAEVECWGKLAENVGNYVKKGRLVAVFGEEQQQNWESQGEQKSRRLVTARRVQFFPDGKQRSDAAEPAPAKTQRKGR